MNLTVELNTIIKNLIGLITELDYETSLSEDVSDLVSSTDNNKKGSVLRGLFGEGFASSIVSKDILEHIQNSWNNNTDVSLSVTNNGSDICVLVKSELDW
jgi:hypothetical protein